MTSKPQTTDAPHPRGNLLDRLTRLYNRALMVRADDLRAILAAPATPDALQSFFSFDFGNPFEARAVHGVSVIPLKGTLLRGMFFDDYEDIRTAFDDALGDRQTHSILFDVDSPGGDASGVFQLSDHIFGSRGEKPIYALANDLMASAAYAISSAADKVFHMRAAAVGSIGVIAVHLDASERDRKEGLKYTEIVSGQHKNELSRRRPLSELGRATIERQVELTAEQFFDTVARNRTRLSAKEIQGQEAAIFFGDEAQSEGLTDGAATLDALIEQLNRTSSTAITMSFPASAGSSEGEAMSQQQPGSSAEPTPAAPAATSVPVQPAATTSVPVQEPAAPAPVAAVVPIGTPRDDQSRAAAINRACKLAGRIELAGDLIAEGLTVEQAMERLLDVRAEASEGPAVDPHHDPNASRPRRIINHQEVYERRAQTVREARSRLNLRFS